jgi:putative hydrolase of the HAD superfamily
MLARGFRVYILSNAGLWMGRTRDFIPNIGRFHGVMFSAEEKLVKPDPRLYLRFQEKFGLRPEECFFIDDKEENVQSAAALGWRTYRFTGDADALKKALDAL